MYGACCGGPICHVCGPVLKPPCAGWAPASPATVTKSARAEANARGARGGNGSMDLSTYFDSSRVKFPGGSARLERFRIAHVVGDFGRGRKCPVGRRADEKADIVVACQREVDEHDFAVELAARAV